MSKVAIAKTENHSYEAIKAAVDQVIAQIGAWKISFSPASGSSSSRIWSLAPRTASPAALPAGRSAWPSMRLYWPWAACL